MDEAERIRRYLWRTAGTPIFKLANAKADYRFRRVRPPQDDAKNWLCRWLLKTDANELWGIADHVFNDLVEELGPLVEVLDER